MSKHVVINAMIQAITEENLLHFNPLMSTLKPKSNGSLYSDTVIGTLAVDGWAVTFGTAILLLLLVCVSFTIIGQP